MEFEALLTVTPAFRTSSGNWGSAKETLFCTFTWLILPSVPLLNDTEIELTPSAELLEVMKSISSTPLICCSSTEVTPCSTDTASAPT